MEAVPARVLAEPERRVRVRDDVRVRLVLEPARLEELPRPRDTFLAVAGEQLLARQALGRVSGWRTNGSQATSAPNRRSSQAAVGWAARQKGQM